MDIRKEAMIIADSTIKAPARKRNAFDSAFI